MSTLQDCDMEQLSRLFARGNLTNAREITRLLKVELEGDFGVRTGSTSLCASLLGKWSVVFHEGLSEA